MDRDKFLPVQLLKTDKVAAEVAFNKLDADDQLEVLLSLPEEKRLDLMLLSDRLVEVVQKFPPTDLWLTIKVSGEESSLDLIRECTGEQLQLILDLECWRRDRWQPADMAQWLKYIAACGEEKILQWFDETDTDLVLLAFKKLISIYKRVGDEDPAQVVEWPRPTQPFTLDGVHYVQAVDEEMDIAIKRIFDVIVAKNMEQFATLMDGLIWDVGVEREESAYEVRERRLAEYGFPGFDEAVSAYHVLSHEEESKLVAATRRKLAKVSAEGHYPAYALRRIDDEHLFVTTAMANITDDALLSAISLELSTLSNNLLIADGLRLSPDGVTESVKKATGYLNIGLEHASNGDLKLGTELLKRLWLKDLFQIGYTQLARLQVKANKFFTDEEMIAIDSPQRECIEGLRKKRPVFVEEGQTEETGSRGFRTLDEVRRVSDMLDNAIIWKRVVTAVFGIDVGPFFAEHSECLDLRLSGLFLTAWCKGLKSKQYVVVPVYAEELHTIIQDTTDEILENSRDEFLKWIISHLPERGVADVKSLNELLDISFNRFAEECLSLKSQEKIDVRYVECVWVVGHKLH